ncbi:unnamed protein product, partial [Sphacelaria rigidula]
KRQRDRRHTPPRSILLAGQSRAELPEKFVTSCGPSLRWTVHHAHLCAISPTQQRTRVYHTRSHHRRSHSRLPAQTQRRLRRRQPLPPP